MLKKSLLLCFLLTLVLQACKTPSEENKTLSEGKDVKEADTAATSPTVDKQTVVLKRFSNEPDTLFVKLKEYSADFEYDLKYATTDNFLKAKVYECAECVVRVKTAKALLAANSELMQKGYKIKFFDCYRPLDVQKKMWAILPGTIYVADPAKGSVHNRGGAVDVTLVTLDGKELDMGTPFDFFGRRAHQDFLELPDQVLANRALLRETMKKHGFEPIQSEWWHYNLTASFQDKVANFTWDCDTVKAHGCCSFGAKKP